MTDIIHQYFEMLGHASLGTQIGNIAFILIVPFSFYSLLQFIYVVLTHEVQKASVIGFHRHIHCFGKMKWPVYRPIISYKAIDGTVIQKPIKDTPIKNIIAADVFVSSKGIRFISLERISIFFAVCSLAGFFISLLTVEHRDYDLPDDKIILGIIIFIITLFAMSGRQIYYADKFLPLIGEWQRWRKDNKITDKELEEEEYLTLIQPGKILTYAETKRLETREHHWIDIAGVLLAVLWVIITIWLEHSE